MASRICLAAFRSNSCSSFSFSFLSSKLQLWFKLHISRFAMLKPNLLIMLSNLTSLRRDLPAWGTVTFSSSATPYSIGAWNKSRIQRPNGYNNFGSKTPLNHEQMDESISGHQLKCVFDCCPVQIRLSYRERLQCKTKLESCQATRP